MPCGCGQSLAAALNKDPQHKREHGESCIDHVQRCVPSQLSLRVAIFVGTRSIDGMQSASNFMGQFAFNDQ